MGVTQGEVGREAVDRAVEVQRQKARTARHGIEPGGPVPSQDWTGQVERYIGGTM